MLDNYGRLFRKVRIDKGISIEKLSNYTTQLDKVESTSKSSISKFENENSNISLPRLSSLLNILNMSIEEFAMYAQEIENPIADDMTGIATAFEKEDIRALEFLSKSFKKQENIIPRYKHLYVLCEALIKRLHNEDIDKNLIKKIENYFQSIDNWYFYELLLFTNTMFLFDSKTIDFLLSRMTKRMNEYKRLSYYYDYVAIMLSNAVTYFLENDQIKFANKHFEVLEEYLKKHPRAIFEKLRCKFLLGFKMFKNNNDKEGIKIMEDVIDQLKVLDLENEALRFEKYLNFNVLKNENTV